ncbi:unnamed protein product [Owenia fusiformis]|uniref:Nephrin n=1 Tax=Owenia fusiformis TaxID=6347 RepID=A0A8S4PVB5_OWEFU|nr:unnamed protein product [Owenia fusiformis]
MEVNKFFNFAVILCVFSTVAHCQKQSFRVRPSDVARIQGQTVTLNCEVDNLAGRVQWVKDGYALGLSRTIPGYPRYSIIGNPDLGEHSLFIKNASLRDDSEFMCQVTPAAGHQRLLASAYLTIMVPPEMPEIEGHTNGTTLEVKPSQTPIEFKCVSHHGKPAANLTWFRNGKAITENVAYSTQDAGNKLLNAMSVLSIIPDDEDNGAFFACVATSPALLNGKELKTVVELSVLHPPGPPEITGYRTGQVVKTGDTVVLVCKSRGGNPLAMVYWYKNDVSVDRSYTTDSSANMARNEFEFVVDSTDNNAVYRCEATNVITSSSPPSASVRMTVQFAPTKVTIIGDQHAKAGEEVTLSCTSTNSNPPALITWDVRGRQVPGTTTQNWESPLGGFISQSNITVPLTNAENDIEYTCQGTNDPLGTTVSASITLSVLYPPDKPEITGYTQGNSIEAGLVKHMMCKSYGGNPTATLTWWKGDELLESTQRQQGQIVTSEVDFIARPDDNGAEYRCNATNPATVTPLIDTITLTVHFPPTTVAIEMTPSVLRAGVPATMICTSASSNPASVITWYRNGRKLQGVNMGVTDAEHGGKSTKSKLEMTPTADDDNAIYSCRASNNELLQATNDAVTLDVLYAPVFLNDIGNKVDSIEGDSTSLNFTASGNPPDVTYTWYKNGEKISMKKKGKRDVSLPHFISDGGVLNITKVKKGDSGEYMCMATNAQGSETINITLNVLYGAKIKSISTPILVDQGDTAVMTCEAEANPYVNDMVKWVRESYEWLKVEQVYTAGKATLTVKNVEKQDSGMFKCVANNNIGKPVEKNAHLIVKYKPEIDRSPQYLKAASEIGGTASLICKAQGAPEITFNWWKGAENLTSDFKHVIRRKKIDVLNFKSTLTIRNITKADYHRYVCIAQNVLGSDNVGITLDGTSKPDPPHSLQYVNSSHNSATLKWTPGFDGGSKTTFMVRYVQTGGKNYLYADVESSIYTITGLKLGTEYEISVRAKNKLGDSPFSPVIKAKTSSMLPDTTTADYSKGDDVPLIIILCVSIIGMVLLGLNVLLILYLIRRRRRKLMEKDSDETISQGNTIEMYTSHDGPMFPPQPGDDKSYTTYDTHDDFTDDIYAGRAEEEEDLKRSFLPQNQDTYPPPGYYSTNPSNGHAVPPADAQRNYSTHQWPNNEGGGFTNSMPRSTRIDEDAIYAETLRKMQQNMAGGQFDTAGRPRRDESGKQRPAGKQAPPPPVRSSSQRSMPPSVPDRNYGPEDIPNSPRYAPAPGAQSTYASLPRGEIATARAKPQVKGQLV